MPYFETPDGTRLSYEDYGSGPPVLFLASWALGADMWEHQVPYFIEHGYRCLLAERRGHGRSDRPPTGYDIATRADDVAALIDHLGLRGAVLVGHSVGGAEVAQYLTRHGDDRVAAAAFVSAMLPSLSRPDDRQAGSPEAALAATIAAFHTDRPRWFADRVQGFFATHLGNDVSPALIGNLLRQCLQTAPYATVEVFRTTFHADHRAALQRLTIPALVVHGAADQSAPVELTGRRTAALVPGCVYREYPAAGHGLFVTHQDQLNKDLLGLLRDPRTVARHADAPRGEVEFAPAAASGVG